MIVFEIFAYFPTVYNPRGDIVVVRLNVSDVVIHGSFPTNRTCLFEIVLLELSSTTFDVELTEGKSIET